MRGFRAVSRPKREPCVTPAAIGPSTAAGSPYAAGSPDAPRCGTLRTMVVDVVHDATGTVRPKKKVNAADELALDTRSARTVRVTKG